MRTVMYCAWSEMKWSIGKHSCLSNHRDMQHQLFRVVLCQASLIEVFKPSRNAFASSISLVPSLTPSLIARSKSFTDFDWMNSWNSTMMLWGSGCKEMLDAESLLSIQGENHDDFIVADSHIYVPNLKDLSGFSVKCIHFKTPIHQLTSQTRSCDLWHVLCDHFLSWAQFGALPACHSMPHDLWLYQTSKPLRYATVCICL